MNDTANWRTPVNAEDYFGAQKKSTTVADRRPLIRKASDLVGPGISAFAVRVTDWNDLLATFDGYFSSEAGADFAPNATDQFVGHVASDVEFGGTQVLTSLASGIVYRRAFVRAAFDSEAIEWGTWWTGYDHTWIEVEPEATFDPFCAFENSWVNYGAPYPPARFKMVNGEVWLDGLVKSGTVAGVIFTLPPGFRPAYSGLYSGIVSSKSRNTSAATGAVTPHTHSVFYNDVACRVNISSGGAVALANPASEIMTSGYLSLSGIRIPLG